MNSIRTTGHWRIYFDDQPPSRSLLDPVVEMIITGNAPEDWLHTRSSVNSVAMTFCASDRFYLFKEYLARNFYENLKALAVGTRAKKAWLNAKVLRDHGFHTPDLLFFGEKRYFVFPLRNIVVAEFLSDATVSFIFLMNNFSAPLNPTSLLRKRSFISSLGHEVGKMHRRGIFHGDLRSGNILVRLQDGNPVFYFIDNERTRFFPKGLPSRLRLKNLVQINMIAFPEITFTDRLRFFRAYTEENPELRSDEKIWLRTVFLKTKSRLQKIYPGIWHSG